MFGQRPPQKKEQDFDLSNIDDVINRYKAKIENKRHSTSSSYKSASSGKSFKSPASSFKSHRSSSSFKSPASSHRKSSSSKSPVRYDKALITRCSLWKLIKEKYPNNPYNPDTNHTITINGPKYKQLNKDCKDIPCNNEIELHPINEKKPKKKATKAKEPKEEKPKKKATKAKEPKEEKPKKKATKAKEPKEEKPKKKATKAKEPKEEKPKKKATKAKEPKEEKPKKKATKAKEPKEEKPKKKATKAKEPKEEKPKGKTPRKGLGQKKA